MADALSVASHGACGRPTAHACIPAAAGTGVLESLFLGPEHAKHAAFGGNRRDIMETADAWSSVPRMVSAACRWCKTCLRFMHKKRPE